MTLNLESLCFIRVIYPLEVVLLQQDLLQSCSRGGRDSGGMCSCAVDRSLLTLSRSLCVLCSR